MQNFAISANDVIFEQGAHKLGANSLLLAARSFICGMFVLLLPGGFRKYTSALTSLSLLNLYDTLHIILSVTSLTEFSLNFTILRAFRLFEIKYHVRTRKIFNSR